MKLKIAGLMMIGLMGCVPGGGTTGFTTAMAGMGGTMRATEPPSKADYALSCKEVNGRLSNLYARYEKIAAVERAKEQQAALVDGALGILGTGMLGNAGSVSAIRNTQAVVAVGQGLSALQAAEASKGQLKTINDSALIAQRTAQLERVKMEKGC